MEGYASLNVPERVDKLTDLLRESSKVVSLNYAISFEPLTPSEFSEWYGDGKSNKTSGPESGGIAADTVNDEIILELVKTLNGSEAIHGISK